jgi:hypothetical protein
LVGGGGREVVAMVARITMRGGFSVIDLTGVGKTGDGVCPMPKGKHGGWCYETERRPA